MYLFCYNLEPYQPKVSPKQLFFINLLVNKACNNYTYKIDI